MSAAQTYESRNATIAFVDLAGFSALADVYGDATAVLVLERFEQQVAKAAGDLLLPVKWIGDEAMFCFAAPDEALRAIGRLLRACREHERIPLTRTAINTGPVIMRGGDVFGSTVNIAARMSALAQPGQMLATQTIANVANASGIEARSLGEVHIRSVATPLELFSIELAEAPEPAWICPVCKMHAPYEAYRRATRSERWFCAPRCAEAYAAKPDAYS
jgi:adenylate cyclase